MSAVKPKPLSTHRLLLAKIAPMKRTLKKVPGLVLMVRLCRLIVNQNYRSEWRLKRAKPDNLFQPYGYTKHNRWPRIFAFVRAQLSDSPTPRLLSFGCSTGEEVNTLRHYFPQAEIVGIDINPRSIALCRKKADKSQDPNIRFELASSPDNEPENFYDAVFCMSVLRHGDLGANPPETCDHLICFADFEKTVNALCRCLKPGGYLIIIASNFRFCDTAIAAEFHSVFSIAARIPLKNTPLYGPDNRRMKNSLYNEAIFCKWKKY